MDTSLSYFSLPFVDGSDKDFSKIRSQECEYGDLHPTLQAHGSLLGADDVLAQFLSGDEPLEEPDLNGPTTLHCEICRKHFDNAKKYYGHLRVHSKENKWICDECPNEKFSTKQQLMKHCLMHKPLERVWRCPQCELSFEALWRLQQHLFAKHLDYRPHKCDSCPKTFHKLSDLDKHKDIHEDIKRHLCTVCNQKFRDKSNLKRHMLSHGNVRPYPCPGCGNRFKQIASMKRHSQNCPKAQNYQRDVKKSYRTNHCRVCGLTFQYKSSLLEHCVREHSNNPPQPPKETPKEDKCNQLHVDTNRTVDNIVDDILSAEDDYITMSTQNDIIYPTIENQDNLMQIELLKEMNQMHILDDELLYNDIDFDSFQTMCNNIDDRNELFDLNDGRSIDHDIMNAGRMDQDIMNALYQVKQENLPEQYLNPTGNDNIPHKPNESLGLATRIKLENLPEQYLIPPGNVNVADKPNEFLDPPVSVNECATIFESDVDLEASTNLAANLNQLIGENTVQYISTEHDDTFIISLNSEIDADQLTDMLNIGAMDDSEKPTGPDTALDHSEHEEVATVEEPSQTALISPIVNTDGGEKFKIGPENKVKKRKTVLYVCRKCNRIFKTKFNYTSHRATHDRNLREYKCRVCSELFSYKSTLNKHTKKMHTPIVTTAHRCDQCDKIYKAAWQLKQHVERDHERIQPYQCDKEGCGKRFYKKSDLDVHVRFHTGEKPYVCDICGRGFQSASHRARHVRNVDCTKTLINREPGS